VRRVPWIVVAREFGVTYSVGHLHRVVTALGFSSQKPERRAREQDPEAVKDFRNSPTTCPTPRSSSASIWCKPSVGLDAAPMSWRAAFTQRASSHDAMLW
jgi:hypothetical protein